jgi:hypothetical protein
MSEIIEVLQTLDNTPAPGGIDERQDFTTNLAVNDVLINPLAGLPVLGYSRLRSATTNLYNLSPSDNFTVLSFGLILPYNFVPSTVNANLRLSYSDDGGATLHNVNQFGASARCWLPFTNYESPCSYYVPFPAGVTNKISLYLDVNSLRVSMLGVPAALGALNIPVSVFIKISHNLDLIA